MDSGMLTRRVRSAVALVGVAATLAFATSGCRPDFDDTSCSEDSDCFQGEKCVQGTCRLVSTDDAEADGEGDATDSGDAGVDGDADQQQVARVALQTQLVELQNGAMTQLSAKAFDAQGNELTDASFSWSVGDSSIASVDSSGTLTAKKVGTTTVRAESQGVEDTAGVRVTKVPVDSVRLAPQSANQVSTQGTLQLVAIPVGPNGNDLCSKSDARGEKKPCGRQVVWASGSPAVATVSETGEVSGVKEGSVRIFATIEGKQSSKQLTVKPNANNPPSISTKGDRSVIVSNKVELDASGTTDPDGHKLVSFQWALTNSPQGANPSLTNPMKQKASFTPTKTGVYKASITVEDEFGATASETVEITVQTQNQAPTADAGMDQVVNVMNMASLDASGSSDPDDSNLNYSWTFLKKPSMSQASLSNAMTKTPSFTVDKPGVYRLEVTVDDGRDSDTDKVVVRGNRAPTANAGSDITVTVGNTAQLSAGASSDPDGDSLSYTWTFTQTPTNASPTLSSSSSATPTFQVNQAGTYTVEVQVDDGNATATDTVDVTGNTAPTAYAGTDTSVHIKTSANVDASNSFDPDSGDTLSYSWTCVSAPMPASCSNISTGSWTATGSFTPQYLGKYEFMVTVTDGNAATQDSVVVTSTNDAPTADATSNSPVTAGNKVSLDASPMNTSTSDPNGDSLTYSWTVTSKPSGASTVMLTDSSAAAPDWNTTASTTTGDYVFEVTVTDDHGGTDTAMTTVKIQ